VATECGAWLEIRVACSSNPGGGGIFLYTFHPFVYLEDLKAASTLLVDC